MSMLQRQKILIAEEGTSFTSYTVNGGEHGDGGESMRRGGGGSMGGRFFGKPLGWAKWGTAMAAEGFRREFEVLDEDDVDVPSAAAAAATKLVAETG